jgi:DNA-directed RNA polymerase specialized sigma24 family protein
MTGPRLFPTKPWAPEEDERLKSMIFAGRTAVEAAIKLGRSVGAVHSRARLLRLSFKRIDVRK